MPALKEIFRRRQKELISSAPIEPATGEEKVRLENECQAYLQDPTRIGISEFGKFIGNLIYLVGGSKKTIGGTDSKGSKLEAQPITDPYNKKTRIFLWQSIMPISSGITITKTTISVGDSEGLKESLGLEDHKSSSGDRTHLLSPLFNQAILTVLLNPSPLNSYILGGAAEAAAINYAQIHLKTKDFRSSAQRLFDIYKGQEAQNQTPQS